MTGMPADPFEERAGHSRRRRLWLLGACFDFECNSEALLEVVDAAFARLPAHRLVGAPHCLVSLVLAGKGRERRTAPPAPRLSSVGGLLCASVDSENFAVVDPGTARAMVSVSPAMLRFAYHVRYELIEFAVQTLAARAFGLVPLHAACVSRDGRAALVVGDSGAGKSTLCLHSLMDGFELVSEDSVFAATHGRRLTGLGSFLHLERHSLAGLPRDVAAELRRAPVIRRRSGALKLEIDLRDSRFALARHPPRLAAVVVLSRRRRRAAALRPLTLHDTRERLRRLQPYAAANPSWRRFERSLEHVPAFELARGAHPAASVDVLRELLARGRT